MIGGIGRLAAADAAVLSQCDGVLVPHGTLPAIAETVAHLDLTRGRRMRVVSPGDVLDVERCVVPWRMVDVCQPHPRLVTWMRRHLGTTPDPALHQRVYIDRRAAKARALTNESEVIGALERIEVVSVTLEGRAVAAQAGLFAGADLIVAPHGAGLANLVFAHMGCQAVKLPPDGYAHWGFRRLSAVAELDHDGVIGHKAPGIPGAPVHDRSWTISLTHVRVAVAVALERGVSARG